MYIPPNISLYHHQNIEEYRGRNDSEAVKAVAKEMEALFAYELIKAMRETTEISSKNNLGEDVYMSMFDMELARLFAERGLGLQDILSRGKNTINSPESATENDQELDPQIPLSEIRYTPQPSQLNPRLSSLPVDGVISSYFGMRRHPLYGDMRFHRGIDIAAPAGTEIYPVERGRVIFSGEQTGYGNVIIIDHGEGLTSKYAHNRINVVKEGDEVDTNTVIAYVGNTGNSTGSHLHFEICKNGKNIDPIRVLIRG
ncbi:MAG: M23 family metallopeptidase [Nitrospirota bacterium]